MSIDAKIWMNVDEWYRYICVYKLFNISSITKTIHTHTHYFSFGVKFSRDQSD